MAFTKRKVLRRDLREAGDLVCLGSVSWEVQSLEDLTATFLSVFVIKWDLGATSGALPAHFSGQFQVSKSQMYFGTWLIKALKVSDTV